ncbi:MAG: sigma-70 factor domain-containing protein, partial [Syntrophobacteraceae bacterium]
MVKKSKIKKNSAAERPTSAEAPENEEARPGDAQDRHQPVSFDPFRLYLDEIKRYPLLSREDEMDLAIRYREKGDIDSAY